MVVARPRSLRVVTLVVVWIGTCLAQGPANLTTVPDESTNSTATVEDFASQRRSYLIATTSIIGLYIAIAAIIATLVTLKVKS